VNVKPKGTKRTPFDAVNGLRAELRELMDLQDKDWRVRLDALEVQMKEVLDAISKKGP